VPRDDLFMPNDEAAANEDGAPTIELGARRMTILHFPDGSMEIYGDDWATNGTECPCGGRGYWTGEMYFWPRGVEIRQVLRNPHWHKPRPRAKVIASLEGGFDRTRTHDGSFPAAMIERDFLIAAQRVCKELGPLYICCEAARDGKNMRDAIADKRRVAPEIFMQVKNLETLVRHSEKFALLDGLLYQRVYDTADGELQLRVCAPEEELSAMEMPGMGRRKLNCRSRILLEYSQWNAWRPPRSRAND